MNVKERNGILHIIGAVIIVILWVFLVFMRPSRLFAPSDNNSNRNFEDRFNERELRKFDKTVLPDLSSGFTSARFLAPAGKIVNGIREVNYEAFKYGFSPDPLIIKAGEKIRLKVKCRDVEHGIKIPEVNLNIDISLDDAITSEFTAPFKPGEYPVFCSVNCGEKHGAMKGTLLVIPSEVKHGSNAPSPQTNLNQ